MASKNNNGKSKKNEIQNCLLTCTNSQRLSIKLETDLAVVEDEMSPGLQLLGPSVSVRLEGEEGREGVLPRPVHLLTQYVGGRWSLCLQFNS